jgi:membrane-associated HD superfamily phosphohydrolase
MFKGLFKHVFVTALIVGVVLLLVTTKMKTHEAKMDESKLRMERSMEVSDLEMADSASTKKMHLARIKEIDAELKEAKERKLAAQKEEDGTIKDLRDSAAEFSKSVEKEDSKDAKDKDDKELKEMNKGLDKDFEKK